MKTISWDSEAQAAEAERIAQERLVTPCVHLSTVLEARVECAGRLAMVRRLLAQDLASPVHDVVAIKGLLITEANLRAELALLLED